MDREKFDRWLVLSIKGNVDFKFNSQYKSFSKIDNGFRIDYMRNKEQYSINAKVIIGADGANSLIRKVAYQNEYPIKKYISIQEWYESSEILPYFTSIFDESVSDFYSWIIPKEKYILVGAALEPNLQANEKYERLKVKLNEYGFKLEKKVAREGAFIYRPTKMSCLQGGRDNIALIGEAAGAISPSSAEGFSYAMKSALYLAQSLNEGMNGFQKRYDHRLRKLRLNILLKNAKSIGMYSPTVRKFVMKSGLSSMEII